MEKKKNKLMKLAMMGVATAISTTAPADLSASGTLLAGGCGGYSRGSHGCSSNYSSYSTSSCRSHSSCSSQNYSGYSQQSCNSYGGYTVHGCGSMQGQTTQHNGTGHQCGGAGQGCGSKAPADSSTNGQPSKVEINAPVSAPADQKQSRGDQQSNRYTISQTTNTAGTVKVDAANAADKAKTQGTNTPSNMLPSGRQEMNPVNNQTPDSSTGSSSKGH